MYTVVLFLHSSLRWIVLLAAVVAVIAAISGVVARRQWTRGDEVISRLFTTAFDAQIALGLLLYVALSPFVQAAMRDPGAAMRIPGLRFFFVEHIFGMLVAFGIARIGRARLRRLTVPAARHRTALIWFGLALIILLISIPWPGLPYGRPLLRVI